MIALDGFRVTTESWNERLKYIDWRQAPLCGIQARENSSSEPDPRRDSEEAFTLQRVAKPTDEQESRWRSWLHFEPSANGSNAHRDLLPQRYRSILEKYAI